MNQVNAMKHLTIRNLPTDISRALEKEKRRRGTSLNQTVIDVLGERLGVSAPEARRNGLKRLAGTWTAEEVAAFHESFAAVEQVDEELWR
jgi:hypothetical protein